LNAYNNVIYVTDEPFNCKDIIAIVWWLQWRNRKSFDPGYFSQFHILVLVAPQS